MMVLDSDSNAVKSETSKAVKPVIQAVKPVVKPVQASSTDKSDASDKSPPEKSPAQQLSPKLRAKQEFKATVNTALPPPSPSGRNSPTTPSTPSVNNAEVEKKIPKTGVVRRDWARKKLAIGLMTGTTDIDRAIDLAIAIEQALLNHFTSEDNVSYNTQLKSISFNLADQQNTDFCETILNGQVTPEQLCTMDSSAMASKEKQEQRKKLWQEKTDERMTYEPKPIESSLYRCGKCKQNKCSYYQMQTRSADEPMTTFVTCHNCGNRWKC